MGTFMPAPQRNHESQDDLTSGQTTSSSEMRTVSLKIPAPLDSSMRSFISPLMSLLVSTLSKPLTGSSSPTARVLLTFSYLDPWQWIFLVTMLLQESPKVCLQHTSQQMFRLICIPQILQLLPLPSAESVTMWPLRLNLHQTWLSNYAALSLMTCKSSF